MKVSGRRILYGTSLLIEAYNFVMSQLLLSCSSCSFFYLLEYGCFAFFYMSLCIHSCFVSLNNLGRMRLVLKISAAKNQYPMSEKKIFTAANGTIQGESPTVNLIQKLGMANALQKMKQEGINVTNISLRFRMMTT